MWTTTSCLDYTYWQELTTDYELGLTSIDNMNKKCKTILRIQEHKTLTTFNYWHWAATASRLQTTIASQEKALFKHRLQTLFVDNYCQQVKKALNISINLETFPDHVGENWPGELAAKREATGTLAPGRLAPGTLAPGKETHGILAPGAW